MKLVRSFAVLTTVLCYATAFIVKDSKISFKDETKEAIELGTLEANTEKLAPISIENVNEILNFKFKLDLSQSKSTEIPEQLSLLVGIADKDLEIPIVPKVKDSSKNKKVKLVSFKIAIEDLPKSILHYAITKNEKITATLLVANEKKLLARKEVNIFQQIFDLQLTENVAYDDDFEEPTRYGLEKELAHTFPAAPTSVPSSLAAVFAGAIIVTNFFLYIYWINFNAISFVNMPSGSDFITFVAFFGSIVAVEYVFVSYYLGTGIFETVNAVGIIACVGLIMGTKFLRSYSQKI